MCKTVSLVFYIDILNITVLYIDCLVSYPYIITEWKNWLYTGIEKNRI